MHVKYHAKGAMGNPNKLQIWYKMSSGDLIISHLLKQI